MALQERAGIIMVNNSNHYSSECQPAANNRDLALTRKRTGHIDAAVRLLGHFVAAALVVLWSVFQLTRTEEILNDDESGS